MLSTQERDWLTRYGKRQYPGSGAVVDLGCWFGSSTLALAQGGMMVDAFDRFKWEGWMAPSVKGTQWEGKFLDGDNFLPATMAQLEPVKHRVRVCSADLTGVMWNNGPIALLFVDAMKSWELVGGIVRGFFPSVGVGSLVVHQDFAHWYTPWIHVLMYRMRDSFLRTEHIDQSGSVAFMVVKRLPEVDVPGWLSVTEEELDASCAWACEMVSPSSRPSILAARAMADAHRGLWAPALTRLRALPSHNEDVLRAIAFIHQRLRS
jgi:hypothetical protein